MSSITRTIQLPVSAAEAFSFFTDSASVATIFGASRAAVYPAIGGEFEIFFGREDVDSTKNCKITEFVPEKKIVAEFIGPTSHRPYGFVKNSMSFAFDEQDGRALVTIAHGDFEDGDKWAEAKQYFEENWERWISNLVVLCAATEQEDQEIPADLLAAVAGGRGGWSGNRFLSAPRSLKSRYNLSSLKLKGLSAFGGAEPPRNVADQA